MKLQPDKFDVPVINGYGPGWIAISGQTITRSVIVNSRGRPLDWDCSAFDELHEGHFSRLVELKPELILFGSGLRQRFAAPAWLATLMERRIGVEAMDTAAACRTYNILAGEGRHVVAALLLETT